MMRTGAVIAGFVAAGLGVTGVAAKAHKPARHLPGKPVTSSVKPMPAQGKKVQTAQTKPADAVEQVLAVRYDHTAATEGHYEQVTAANFAAIDSIAYTHVQQAYETYKGCSTVLIFFYDKAVPGLVGERPVSLIGMRVDADNVRALASLATPASRNYDVYETARMEEADLADRPQCEGVRQVWQTAPARLLVAAR